jgi:hypothetical protein
VTASDAKLKRAISLAIIVQFTASDWTRLGLLTGTSEIIDDHPRLLRSLQWDDDDYPSCVTSVVGLLFDELSTRELVAAIEDIIDLPSWLQGNHTNLFRDIYESEFDSSLLQLEREAIALGASDIPRHIARIRRSIDTDPEQAIGSSKELLECVLRTILDDHSEVHSATDNLPKLLKEVRRTLDLESGKTGIARDRILNGLTSTATGITELRNLHGTGHGRSRTTEPDIAYAHLAVSSSAALAHFLIIIHTARNT